MWPVVLGLWRSFAALFKVFLKVHMKLFHPSSLTSGFIKCIIIGICGMVKTGSHLNALQRHISFAVLAPSTSLDLLLCVSQ